MTRDKFIKLLLFVSCMAISGCKEILYSNLTEVEANEMVAVLSASNIEASRSRDKDGVYDVLVEKRNIPFATILLKKAGLPRETFASLGDVFSSSGIVGTPFEQHARFIYAMNEELSRTLSEIDGVKSARVFVNSPIEGRYSRKPPESTASVTLHFEPDFNVEKNIPKIKKIVSHSLSNLPYDNVSVAFFPVHGLSVEVVNQLGSNAQVSTAAVLPIGKSMGLKIENNVLFWIGFLIFGFVLMAMLFTRTFTSRQSGPVAKPPVDLTGRNK